MSREFILWCDFCKHLNDENFRCYDCDQSFNLKPSYFEEKPSVEVYRNAMSEVLNE